MRGARAGGSTEKCCKKKNKQCYDLTGLASDRCYIGLLLEVHFYPWLPQTKTSDVRRGWCHPRLRDVNCKRRRVTWCWQSRSLIGPRTIGVGSFVHKWMDDLVCHYLSAKLNPVGHPFHMTGLSFKLCPSLTPVFTVDIIVLAIISRPKCA